VQSCTFFGHHNTPETVRPILKKTICSLIENNQVDTFYIGHQGWFDAMVKQILCCLESQYPHVRFYTVLAYHPARTPFLTAGETLYPFGLESIPPRYAILKCNEWMITHADYVVTYVEHAWGNAAKMQRMAERKQKYIIPLYKDAR